MKNIIIFVKTLFTLSILIDGIICVAQDYSKDLENTLTLKEFYLDPLVETIHQNDGAVLPGSQ